MSPRFYYKGEFRKRKGGKLENLVIEKKIWYNLPIVIGGGEVMTFVLYLVEMIKFAIIYRMGFWLPFKKNIISYITLIVSWVGISVYMILFE